MNELLFMIKFLTCPISFSVRHFSGGECDEDVAAMKPLEDFLEDAVLVEAGVIRLDRNSFRNPSGERVKVDVAVRAGEVVATHDLHVNNETNFDFFQLIKQPRVLPVQPTSVSTKKTMKMARSSK